MGSHDGQGPTTLDPRQRTRVRKKHHTRVDTAVLSQLVMSGQTRKVSDEETDVNSADLQGFVLSELEALSAGIDDLSSDLSSVLTHEESVVLVNTAMNLISCP